MEELGWCSFVARCETQCLDELGEITTWDEGVWGVTIVMLGGYHL